MRPAMERASLSPRPLAMRVERIWVNSRTKAGLSFRGVTPSPPRRRYRKDEVAFLVEVAQDGRLVGGIASEDGALPLGVDDPADEGAHRVKITRSISSMVVIPAATLRTASSKRNTAFFDR